MACGERRVARCVSYGVALGYGGYGLRPKARGPVCVLGRCPRLWWLWPAAKGVWPGVCRMALP